MDNEKSKRSFIEYIKDNKVTVAFVSAIVAVIVTVSIVYGVIFSSIFRISRLEKIEIGHSMASDVESVLGEPTAKYNKVWEYYESSIVDDVNEANEATEKGDFETADRLLTELRSKTFDYIRVTFSDDRVSQVLYDAACRFNGSAVHDKKADYKLALASEYIGCIMVDCVKTVVDGGVTYTPKNFSGRSLVYSAEFADGSYISARADVTFEVIDDKPYLVWSDMFATYRDSSLIRIVSE